MKTHNKKTNNKHTSNYKTHAGCSAHAEKQDPSQHKPDTVRTLQHKKGEQGTATAPRLQVGLTDARSFTGGRNKAAFSNGRSGLYGVYDPWLGKHPIPTVNVPNLLEQIVADTNFNAALVKVNSEPRKAVGCDRKTVREVCVPLLNDPEAREKIRQRILQGKYVPHEVRITEIPKANGKKRKLGIATVLDRVVQNMILLAVTKNTPEDTWSEYSYAYRKNRRVADAIAEVDKIRAEGYKFGIILDLKAFFDNVPHDRLVAKIYKHLAAEALQMVSRKEPEMASQTFSSVTFLQKNGVSVAAADVTA
ncbi:MAG: hypothetical protein J5944_08185 [Lentisphaeria bacterium]|nr:hypothetical protein [Lentisphaeria bacterium]